MLQAENSFGGFAHTHDGLGFVLEFDLVLELDTRFLLHRRFEIHIHRVAAFTNRARVALSKDLRRFRLQAFDERRVAALGNPKVDFRNFRQRCQFLQMRHRRLKQKGMVSYEMKSDL